MKGKHITKRAFALALTVVMLVSCWVFTAPTAEGATAGKYYVRVTFRQTGSVTGFTSGTGLGDECNDSCGCIVRYKTNNGTGSTSNSNIVAFDVNNNTNNQQSAQINGFPDLVYLYYDENRVAGTRYAYLTKLEVSGNNSTWTELWSGELQVGSVNNPYAISVDSSGTIKKDWIKTDKECKMNSSSGGWNDKFPEATFNGCSYSDTTGVNAPNACTVSTAASFNSKDQYGVTLGGTFSVSYELTRHQYLKDAWEDQTLPNDSISFDTSTGKITPLKANGYPRHDNYVVAHGTWSYKSSTTYSVNAGWIKLTYPSYTLSYSYTSNTDPTSWTVNTSNTTAEYIPYATTSTAESSGISQTVYWGDTAGTAPTATASHRYYYDNAGHYINGSYTNPTAAVKKDEPVPMANYTTKSGHHWSSYAQFTGIQNGVFTPADYHRATCSDYNQTHYKYQLHQWGTGSITTEPTCTSKGVRTYTCSCGATKTEDVAIVGSNHNWTSIKLDGDTNLKEAATCTTDAEYWKVCSYNHAHISSTESFVDEGSALDHSFTAEDSTKAGALKSAATCTQPAKYYYSCSRCGTIEHDDNHTFAVGTALGHNIEQKDGSDRYYSDGSSHWRNCLRCEQTLDDNDVVGATSVHAWDAGVIAEGDEATCVAKGHTTYTCEVCAASDRREDIEINANNHNWVLEEQKAVDGTDGYVYYRCANSSEHFCAAQVDNTSETHYAPSYSSAEDLKPNAAATESASVQIPAPTFNDSATDTIYNVVYASRLASIRIEPEKATQAMRFAGSVEVPSGISTAIGSESVTDNVVLDFGFVYTQTRFITLKDGTIRPDYLDFNGNAATGKPTAAKGSIGYQIYQMSVKRNNSGLAYNGSSGWAGVTQRTIGGKTYLTFNLVIEVTSSNWGREYSARPYIIYKYNGHDYTVYDNGRVATDEDSTYYYNSVNDIAESIMYDNEDMEYYVGIETPYQSYVDRLLVLERDKRYCLEKIFAARVAAADVNLNNVSQVDNFCWNNDWCTPNQIKAFRNYVTESIYLSGDASSFVYPE